MNFENKTRQGRPRLKFLPLDEITSNHGNYVKIYTKREKKEYMEKYYAVYSKDRKAVICRVKNASVHNVSSTRSLGQKVEAIEDGLEIRVLKSKNRQQAYADSGNERAGTDFWEVVEVNESGEMR